MDALIDANGNVTMWQRDIQGRVTTETRANGSEWSYEYENTTSRLKTVIDPKAQVKTYSYFADDNPSGVVYTNEEHATPDVSYSYETEYNRLATMVDGTGTTSYAYHPIGAAPLLGAGRLASVDGPLSNDAIAYAYDELGRVSSRAIDGVALSYDYDELGRIETQNNVLGAFSFQYDGVTNRLEKVTYPNGQASDYAYYANSGDRRLQEIHHKKPDGTTLAKFDYTYDAVGNIQTWSKQQGTNPAKAYDFEYDTANQLQSAVWRTTDPTPTILKRYSYTYDPAGNRTGEEIDDTPFLSAYDNMNRLLSQSPGGTLRFAGTLSEPATVSIQGAPATVTSDDDFEGGAQVGSGTSQVVVKAKDYSENERTNTYEVGVTGSSQTFTFDANGNMIGDGTRTFEWDAENRLGAVKEDSSVVASFTYSGLGRRATKIANGTTTVYVYDGSRVVEQRSDGDTARYFFGRGLDDILAKQAATGTYYYVRDHLGSVHEVTDASSGVVLTREYDPWGNPILGSSTSGYSYTGREWDAETSLYYYRARYYDPKLGIFLSEDPIGFRAATNFYSYVRNRPTSYRDPFGLRIRLHVEETPPEYDLATTCSGKAGGTCYRRLDGARVYRCAPRGDCYGFDVDVTYNLHEEFTVSEDEANEPGSSEDTPGLSLKEHEDLHMEDMRQGLSNSAINSAIQTEDFKTPGECESARLTVIGQIDAYVAAVAAASHAARDKP